MAAAVVVVAVLPMLIGPAVCSAGEGRSGTAASVREAGGSGARLSSRTDSGRTATITVYSPSMGRDIPLEVILPADGSEPRPTLYLLNGAGGGEDAATTNPERNEFRS